MPWVVIQPTQWAWVDAAASSVNHGSTSLLYIRSESTGDRRIYLKYDLTSTSDYVTSGLAAPPTTDSTIVRATVGLQCDLTSGNTTAETIDGPREVTAAWNSSDITWSTVGGGAGQPARSTTREAVVKPHAKYAVVGYDCRDIVQGWSDKTLTNHGLWMGATTEGSTGPYQWRFRSATIGGITTPMLHIEYRDIDTLPSTAVDNRKAFVGRAITDLSRSTIKEAEWTLTLELTDGDLVVTDDVISFSNINRRLPFLLEDRFSLGSAMFRLHNEDGTYSPHKKSSKLYARRAIGQNIKLELTVADQTVTVYRGQIENIVLLADGQVEIIANYQPVKQLFKLTPGQNDPDTGLVIYLANPADAMYELLHNQLGVADTDINLASFIAAKAIWTAQNFTIGVLWAEKTAEELASLIMEAGMGALYFDWQGRYALHAWKPSEPTCTELEDIDNYEWYEEYGKIRNMVRVGWGYEDGSNLLYYQDPESQRSWGMRELEIHNPLLRRGGRAAHTAVLYTQALADPVGMARVSGGMNLLRFELGDGVTLVDAENELDEDCIVTGINLNPLTGDVSLSLIKSNWPLPRRDYVNTLTWGESLGDEEYYGTSTRPINNPVPSAFNFYRSDDGGVLATPEWTYSTGDAPIDGFRLLANVGTTSPQPVPSSSDADKLFDVSPSNRVYAITIAQNQYVSVGIQAYRHLSVPEQVVIGEGPIEYTSVVTSSSTPDWTNRQYQTKVKVGGDIVKPGTSGSSSNTWLDGTSGIMTQYATVEDQRCLRQISVGNRESYIGEIGLRSTDTTGALAKISWDNFNVRYGHGQSTYLASGKANLVRGVVYHVYADPALVGSSTYTYYATTDYETVFSGVNRLYVGSIVTATTTGISTEGSGGGGGGDPPLE